MNFFTFYFIGVGVIFLTKLIFNLISFKNLKRYMNENKKRIDFLLREEQIDYTDLIIYHFATNVYDYTKYKNELEHCIEKEGGLSLVITFFVCVFWLINLKRRPLPASGKSLSAGHTLHHVAIRGRVFRGSFRR